MSSIQQRALRLIFPPSSTCGSLTKDRQKICTRKSCIRPKACFQHTNDIDIRQGRWIEEILWKSKKLELDCQMATILAFVDRHWAKLPLDHLSSMWFGQFDVAPQPQSLRMTKLPATPAPSLLPGASSSVISKNKPLSTSQFGSLSIDSPHAFFDSFTSPRSNTVLDSRDNSTSSFDLEAAFSAFDDKTLSFDDMYASLQQLYISIPDHGLIGDIKEVLKKQQDQIDELRDSLEALAITITPGRSEQNVVRGLFRVQSKLARRLGKESSKSS